MHQIPFWAQTWITNIPMIFQWLLRSYMAHSLKLWHITKVNDSIKNIHKQSITKCLTLSLCLQKKKPNTCLESNKPMHTRAGIRVLMIWVSYQLSKTFHPPLFSKLIYFSPFTEEIQSHWYFKTNNAASAYVNFMRSVSNE